jgi:hypothetical protein
LSLPSLRISEDKKQSTKFTESKACAVGFDTPALVPELPLKKGELAVVAVCPAKLLEGYCCSEAFATAGSYWDDALIFLFGPYL